MEWFFKLLERCKRDKEKIEILEVKISLLEKKIECIKKMICDDEL